MKTTALLCAAFALAIGFVACDPGSIVSSGAPAATPGINISGPSSGSTVMIAADNLVPVTFVVSHFSLAPPGACAGDWACGHVHLKVDGAACNDAAAMKPYNTAGWSSPINANLGFCPTAEGQHEVLLELHHDDHTPFKDSSGAIIGASSQFAAQRNQTAATPSITISEPMQNATVTMAAGNTVPITFSVMNFVLKAPGTCLATDGACGHVHVKVDGNGCNNTAAMKPYNNAGFASPISADLAFCPMATGAHTISLELHNNDHTPVLDPTTMMVISANVAIQTQ
jgi:hypothetical protein